MPIEVLSKLELLENWINKNGYKGFDPYDIKDIPLVIKLTDFGNKNYFNSVIREILFELFYSFPLLSRHIFRIEKRVNAKAMGLLASSYGDLYTAIKNEAYLHKMNECLDWLKNNQSITVIGNGWGYPFNWQAKKLVPAETPNGVVTTAVGDAFWKHFLLTGDPESLAICKGICEYLCTLPRDKRDTDRLCFSYTPIFINHVHNLNLFVAEFLIRVGSHIDNPEWLQLGNKAINYTLSDQLNDGSFDYNGPPELPNRHIDNYHTGFVLRMLYALWKLTGRKDLLFALNKCYTHYIHNFFENDQIPKFKPNKKYRIDIHSCAESIHCLSELNTLFPDSRILAENILKWTFDHLQDKSGYFYYGILKSRFTGIPFKSKIPYIRWGQAWMLRALSSYLVSVNMKKK